MNVEESAWEPDGAVFPAWWICDGLLGWVCNGRLAKAGKCSYRTSGNYVGNGWASWSKRKEWRTTEFDYLDPSTFLHVCDAHKVEPQPPAYAEWLEAQA